MGKQIAKNDYPRQVVLWMGWFEIAGYYFEALLPYVTMSSERSRTYVLVAKHLAIQAMNFAAINIRIAYNISGMLSSSFQPEDV